MSIRNGRSLLVVPVLAAALAAFALPVLAQGAGRGGAKPAEDPVTPSWWSSPDVIERLGLKPDQRKRIEEAVFRSSERLVDLRAEKEKAHLEMGRQLVADTLDDAALEKSINRTAEAQCALEKAQIALRVDIARILTREQRIALRDLVVEHRGGHGPRGGRH
jgi:Spy/CpxP family protein refolding chaperone